MPIKAFLLNFRICPNGTVCLPDVAEMNPDYGYTNFDNIGFSLLTSFQLITLDFWENVYNMVKIFTALDNSVKILIDNSVKILIEYYLNLHVQ